MSEIRMLVLHELDSV